MYIHTGLSSFSGGGELPEDVGKEAALLLLDEVAKSGVVDRTHQPLFMQLMVLGTEDICKVSVPIILECISEYVCMYTYTYTCMCMYVKLSIIFYFFMYIIFYVMIWTLVY